MIMPLLIGLFVGTYCFSMNSWALPQSVRSYYDQMSIYCNLSAYVFQEIIWISTVTMCHCCYWHPVTIAATVKISGLWYILSLKETVWNKQPISLSSDHDVIKWKHFPRYGPFVWSQVNSTLKGQWRGALMFSLIYAWINCWVNNR